MHQPTPELPYTAIDKRTGITLGELRGYLAAADRLQLPDTTELHAEITIRGRIKKLSTQPST
ncbi:hypothetical protein [uncultured Aeromicrobium sp.]|uniref:hypothetical protein n=1 Tax=uncultured Aeromicrobium sp. TaxID=337820 RepID=UPI0025DD3D2A|nr:hypothetical protein [uncultured Aeromicrobium sp.]